MNLEPNELSAHVLKKKNGDNIFTLNCKFSWKTDSLKYI